MPSAPPASEDHKYLGLISLGSGIEVRAHQDGLRIVSATADLRDRQSLFRFGDKADSILGRSLPTLIPQILELGRAIAEGPGSLLISYDNLHALEDEGIGAFDGIAPWAPFVLEVHSSGSLGTAGFRYGYRFYLGIKQVVPKQYGAFTRLYGKTYRFDRQTFALQRAIDEANEAADTSSPGSGAWLRFSKIKWIADDIGAQLDSYLYKERVVIPSEIGLNIEEDEQGRITFVPQIQGVPRDSLKRSFLQFDDVHDVYSMDHPDGGRVRVVLGEQQKEVFRRMQKVRYVSGTEKAKVLGNPAGVFDGVAEVLTFDGLGPRVAEIGKFPFATKPYLGSTGILDSEEGSHGGRSPSIGLECQYEDGTRERIEFRSTHEFEKLLHDVKLAQSEGKGTVEFRGVTVVIEPDFVRGMAVLKERLFRKESDPRNPKEERDARYLLIYRNEDEVDYVEEETADRERPWPIASFPESLLAPDHLKQHQKEGFAWLELNYALRNRGRRGCLLADDMGLGKTLQVLSFLARLVEKGEVSDEGSDPSRPPWNPILVVAPVILLEDKTWIRDMEKFFRHRGSVFEPYLVFHGKVLKELRRDGYAGRETVLGEPVLDLEELRRNRLIFTNYETVVNYQHSLARIKWAAVVTDEAQEYKTPSTKISHALKSLDPGYRIACTGTPVETRLLDLWNIFDFLQPGPLLGSAREFSDNYEKPLDESEQKRIEVLETLKERLRLGKVDSYVKRREKDRLADLPPKQEHVIGCDLSDLQREMHLDFLGRLRSSDAEHHLSIIHSLMFLYQHPDLVSLRDGMLGLGNEEIVARCPKLAAVLRVLMDIKTKNEKVLIFTRSLIMQQVLANVIGQAFGLQIDIVNGGTKRNLDTKSGGETRKSMLERFQTQPGFNVIVLSPDVAGYGLTLTAANHVIHYGRWWNPAKEAQATDRVYRIGQEKEVHVYYPIAKDPRGEFKTFDEKLDALLVRRRTLAKDFLMPMPGEDDLGRELLNDILGMEERSETPRFLTDKDICVMPWDRFEALNCLIEQKMGRDTILTPASGDQGMDVISRMGNAVRLTQCKHTSFAAELDEDSVDETVFGFDGYRARYLAGSTFGMAMILATNGRFTKRATSVARLRGVTLVSGSELRDLLVRYPCSLAEVELAERSRCRSMKEVAKAIESWKR